jgi:hypothetical protein
MTEEAVTDEVTEDVTENDTDDVVVEEPTEAVTTDDKTYTIDEIMNGAWREIVDPEYGENSVYADAKTLEDVLKQGVNAAKLVGRKGIIPPSSKASDEEWKDYFKQLGMPDSEAGYDLEYKKQEGVPYDIEFEKAFRSMAHKNGLSKKHAQEVYNFIMSKSTDGFVSSKTRIESELAAGWESLKQEWGKAYNEKMNLANKALASMADEDTISWLKSSGLHQNPKMVKLAAKFGEHLKEDVIEVENKGNRALTTKEARSKINKIYADASNPLNPHNPAYNDEAAEELAELFKFAYPDET